MSHACCRLDTLEHLTTCHHCGVRAEVMDVELVGEPICSACERAIRREGARVFFAG